MGEASKDKRAPQLGMLAGILAVLLLLRRCRKRRKEKKLLRERVKARARLEEQRRKEEEGRRKARRKAGKKERTMVEQLVRFAVFQLLKKAISQQIKAMEVDLGKGKLGKKIVGAAEQTAS